MLPSQPVTTLPSRVQPLLWRSGPVFDRQECAGKLWDAAANAAEKEVTCDGNGPPMPPDRRGQPGRLWTMRSEQSEAQGTRGKGLTLSSSEAAGPGLAIATEGTRAGSIPDRASPQTDTEDCGGLNLTAIQGKVLMVIDSLWLQGRRTSGSAAGAERIVRANWIGVETGYPDPLMAPGLSLVRWVTEKKSHGRVAVH